METPPPPPPAGEDALDPDVLLGTLGLCMSSAKQHAIDWRARAKEFPVDREEQQRCTEASKCWDRVAVVLKTRRDANTALAASPPELVAGAAPDVPYDEEQTNIIVKAWKKRKTQAGDAQVTAWQAHKRTLGGLPAPAQGNKRPRVALAGGAAVGGAAVGVAAEFPYVDHLPQGHARAVLG